MSVTSGNASVRTTKVVDGDNLQTAIDNSEGGVILVGNGTYSGFRIVNRRFAEDNPLIIRAAPGEKPLIKGDGYKGKLIEINDSSYIVLDGLTTDGGNYAIYGNTIEHGIFVNLELRNTGQEMIQVRGTTRYLDIINCHIHHSGYHRPQWSEGIYIGQGSLPYENSEHIWIEGNDIHHNGNSEGINIKCRTYHVTIRGNKVHDIAPGTEDQYNVAAISVEPLDLDFRPGVETDIWIEDNEVYNVTYGRWANGIQATGMGPRIKNNFIHHCLQHGIYLEDTMGGKKGFTTYLFGNRIENCINPIGYASIPYKFEDPGTNPNRPQEWYKR